MPWCAFFFIANEEVQSHSQNIITIEVFNFEYRRVTIPVLVQLTTQQYSIVDVNHISLNIKSNK